MSEEQYSEDRTGESSDQCDWIKRSREDQQRSQQFQQPLLEYDPPVQFVPVPYEPTQRTGHWQREYYGGTGRTEPQYSSVEYQQLHRSNPTTQYPASPDYQPPALYPSHLNVPYSPFLPLQNFSTRFPLDPPTSQSVQPDPRYSSDYSFSPHSPVRLDSDRTVRPIASPHSSYRDIPLFPHYPPPVGQPTLFLPSAHDNRPAHREPQNLSSSEEISPLSSGHPSLPSISPPFQSNYPLPQFALTGGGESSNAAKATERRTREYLERNRRAAIKSRQKKKDVVKGLEASAKRLSESNQDLQSTASSLELEVAQLRDAIHPDRPHLPTAPDRTMLLDYSRVPSLGSQHDVYGEQRTTGLSPVSDDDADESTSREDNSSSSNPSGALSSIFATTAIASISSAATASASTDEIVGTSSRGRDPSIQARGRGLVIGVPRGGEAEQMPSRESSEDSLHRLREIRDE